MSDSDQQIVARANGLARQFYMAQGYRVKEGYRFDQATHPQERGCWNQAVIAYCWIEGTDVEDALMCMEEDENE